MPTPQDLFQELKDALDQFKTFLTSPEFAKVKAVITALIDLIPKIGTLIDDLVKLLGEVRKAVINLKLPAIPDLDNVLLFTKKVQTLVEATEALLPPGDETANDVIKALGFAASLPTITDSLKNDITMLIDDIVHELESLRPA